MSRNPPAPSPDNDDITRQAEEQRDRDALDAARRTVRKHGTIGSWLGQALGLVLAVSSRRKKMRMFEATSKGERPVAVRFRDGREQLIPPDLATLKKPSNLGDLAAYAVHMIEGTIIGAVTGIATGSVHAAIEQDGERVGRANAKYRADKSRKAQGR